MRRLGGGSVLFCCAIFAMAVFITGCGGGSSNSPNTPPPTSGQFVHIYVVFPPASGVNNQHFMNTVMNQNAINGVTVATSWVDVETQTPGTNICGPVGTDICQQDAAGFTHAYDWSTVDSGNMQWFTAQSGSKKVNIILDGIGGAAPNCALTNSCINPITPYYVTQQFWATDLGTTLQDVINVENDGCTNNVGLNTTSMVSDNTGLVTVTEPNNGYSNGDTIWVAGTTPASFNVGGAGVPVQGVNTAAGTFQYQSSATSAMTASTPGTVISAQQSYPVPYEKPFVTAWEAFIAAAVYHFNHLTVNGSPALPQIGYMRVGRSVGGEAYPYCVPNMQALPAPNTYTKQGWLNYYNAIDSFVAAQKPQMLILDPLNQEGVGTSVDVTYGDAEAATANMTENASGLVNGFGSQGLQASDITNYAAGQPCSSDWCAMFNMYYQTNNNLELQQLGLSAPVNGVAGTSESTGSLVPLLPFAVSRHMTILELYNLDALLAYDPNYCVLNNPDNQQCNATGSVQISPIDLPPGDQYLFFQAVGQPGQTGSTGQGQYATVINQTQGQH